MRALLINPNIHDFSAFDFWMKPLGLLYLAALLRENGHEVDLIDCMDPWHPGIPLDGELRVPVRRHTGRGKFPFQVIPKPEPIAFARRKYRRFGISPRMLRDELLRKHPPDAVFVTSMMTYWYPGVFESIRSVREVFPGAPVILGGVYASLCTSHAVSHSGADFVLPGGCEAVPSFLEKTFGFPPLCIPNANDPDTFPYPAFDLLSRLEQVPILSSHGCRFRCTYCASHLLRKKFLVRDPARTADEIEFWRRKFGVREFSFYDDGFLAEAESSAIPLLREIIRRKLDCFFHTPNGLHARWLTAEAASLMFRAGFQTVRLGFETSDSERQAATGGKVRSEELREAIARLRESGFREMDIGVYILCGLPGQEFAEIKESLEFVRSCGGRPYLTEFSPIPGTAIWKDCIAASSLDIEREPLFHNNTLLPCRDASLTEESFQHLKIYSRTPPEVGACQEA